MKSLKVAVIGCGNISVMHLDSIASFSDVELVAVCDIIKDKAVSAAEKYNAKAYTDYSEMFKTEKLDAVHICLPHYLHTVVAKEAFKYGINVLSEKPMSINYRDALDAVTEAEKSNLKYGIVFQCRYNAPSQLVKKLITNRKLGKVKCARITLTWCRLNDYYKNSDWKGTLDKEGGGVVIDQAIHSLDLANWFIDSEPVEVQSTLHNRNHQGVMCVEDSAEGLIKYKNGALLFFYAMNNYLTDEPIEIRLLCENGTAVLSYDEADIKYSDGSTERVCNENQTEIEYSGGKRCWGTQHAVLIHRFYQAVKGKAELEISGKEALKTQKLICDIYKNNDNKFEVN